MAQITKKITLNPIFSERKEYITRIKSYTIEDLQNNIDKSKKRLKKIKKEETEEREKILKNISKNEKLLARINSDDIEDKDKFTKNMVIKYTKNLVKEAMKTEAQMKNYTLSYLYSEMIKAGLQNADFSKKKNG